ncbi:MAG: type 4b pilus protein PilO2 [Rickettsiales bacterium]|nr:type 4b pilus protein PilO2 [Rickettsiales bacterium]
MAGNVITISRRKYAAGLFWQPAPPRGGARENAAKISRAAKTRSSLYCAFSGMIGLSSRRGGARAGMPVAAAEVMESFGEQTFLASFAVREGWWILAVRGGIIIRDKVFSKAPEAAAEYLELAKMPDWAVLAAPADWNAPSAVERRLDEIISGAKKYRLANISHLAGYIITAAILCGAVFVGYEFFREPIMKMFSPERRELQINPELAAEYKKGLAKIDAPAPAAAREIHVVMPWENLPTAAARAELCWKAIAFLSQQITGWVVESVVCAEIEAIAHLLRNYGTIGDLYDEVAAKMPGVLIDETGGSDVILTAKLRPLETADRAPEFSSDQIMTAVQSVFQKIDEPIDFMRDFVQLARPEPGENEVLDSDLTDAPVVRIEAVSKLQPKEFVKIMSDVPSVRIPMIKWDNGARNWIYTAVIYVK